MKKTIKGEVGTSPNISMKQYYTAQWSRTASCRVIRRHRLTSLKDQPMLFSESEWGKVFAGLHAANGCPRVTHLKRGKWPGRELIFI
ncbi:hypothetical protein H5410_046094 [Solanum commersonii]|uniref:Uncharacterized protein n=1 Tax=Solanum commersonii TaxID=4109 RepID=A0A9J5XEK7_SOLCO|nr:hypothetical protein H5410_046094 [Solanum commersonii]